MDGRPPTDTPNDASFYDQCPDFHSISEEHNLLSRLRIIVLFAALAALATTIAACGGGGGSSEDPQKVIQEATFEGVESGKLDLSLGVKSEGKEGGDLNVELSGPFQSKGKEALPEFAFEATAKGSVKGENVDFEGGLTVLSDRAFVGFQGSEYEVDPTTFGFVKSAFEQAQQKGSKETGNVTACQEAATGLSVEDFVENLTSEGSTDVEGTSTTKVSGDLDVGGAIDQIIKLTENPACAAQLEAAGPLPIGELEEAKEEVTKAVKEAHVDVYVGDDHIIRRIAANLTIEPEGKSGERVEIEFDVTLGAVNEEQTITPPSGAKPLEGLFRELGINPVELLEGGAGGGGFGGLLEGLMEGGLSGGSSGGGSSSGGGASSSQQAYIECLQGAQTPADLQKCASLLQ